MEFYFHFKILHGSNVVTAWNQKPYASSVCRRLVIAKTSLICSVACVEFTDRPVGWNQGSRHLNSKTMITHLPVSHCVCLSDSLWGLSVWPLRSASVCCYCFSHSLIQFHVYLKTIVRDHCCMFPQACVFTLSRPRFWSYTSVYISTYLQCVLCVCKKAK